MVSAYSQHGGVSHMAGQVPAHNSALDGERCSVTATTIGSSEGSCASTLGTSSEGMDDKVLIICDPATKQKITIPFGLTEQTSGRILYFQNLTNPSRRESHICMLYQKGKCRSNIRCNQVHVDRGHIARLRAFHFELNGQRGRGSDDSHQKSLEVVVKDPKSSHLKIIVPYSKTEETLGREDFLSSSKGGTQTRDFSLCTNHMKGSACSMGNKCKFIHVSSEFMTNLQNVDKPCCPHHGGVPAASVLSSSLQLVMINKVSQRCNVLHDRVATTAGLREIVASNPASQTTIVFCCNRVCRLHQEKRCHHGAGCSNLHICRTYYALFANAAVPGDVRIPNNNKTSTAPSVASSTGSGHDGATAIAPVLVAPQPALGPHEGAYSNMSVATTVAPPGVIEGIHQSMIPQNVVTAPVHVQQVHHHHQHVPVMTVQPPPHHQHQVVNQFVQPVHTQPPTYHNTTPGAPIGGYQSTSQPEGCVTGMPLTTPMKDTFGIPLVTREGTVPSHLLPPNAVGVIKAGATGVPLTQNGGLPVATSTTNIQQHPSSCNNCGAIRSGSTSSLDKSTVTIPVDKDAASIPYADSEPSQTPPTSPKQPPKQVPSATLQQCYSHQKLPQTQSFSQQNDPYLNVPQMSSHGSSIVQIPAAGLPQNNATLPHTWSEVVRQTPHSNHQQQSHPNSAYFSRQHAREFILQPELQVHDSFVDPMKAVLTSPCTNPACIPHKT
eukprot:TRINITY_DN19143_c0_g1_i1.p1 TRINITY_DN19143_c0_g1~~TRINITY_DN19143_c0_g1_i1.p1  ORF type:complete len:720 (+),score=85.31 TRINITY_DN19143_c0_g1_i1:41-2200(+)